MKKININILRVITPLLLFALVASCAQDDFEQGSTLPAGQYPLNLSVSVEGMKSRAEGKDKWNNGDTFGVRIGSDSEVGLYTLDYYGNVDITNSANILHWKTTSPATVKAWYPSEPQTDISIANQSGLKDLSSIDYLAATAENQSYKSPVGLTFTHQMAKVRCVLESAKDSGLYNDDLSSATVTFKGCTAATFADGVLTGSGFGDIVPFGTYLSREALLVPTNMTGKELFRIDINLGGYDKSFSYTPTGDYADLKPGTSYVFKVTLSRDMMVVSPISASWDGDVEEISPNAIPLQLYLPEEFFNLLNDGTLTISENARPSTESEFEDIIPEDDKYLVDGNSFTISLTLDDNGENFMKGFTVTEGVATVNRVRFENRHVFTIKANTESMRLEYGDYIQLGDFLYSNGKWRPDLYNNVFDDEESGDKTNNDVSDRELEDLNRTPNYGYGYDYNGETWKCIGVIFKAGIGNGDSVENYGGRLETIHGYAVALHDAAAPNEIGSWGLELDIEAELGVCENGYINVYDGYTNTQKMLPIVEANKGKIDGAGSPGYWAFHKLNDYKNSVEVPDCASTWYIPSIGQLSDLYKFAGRHDRLISAGGEDFILNDVGIFETNANEFDPMGAKYWSSTQASRSAAWAFRFQSGLIINIPKMTPNKGRLLNRSRVRAVLTF